MKKNDQSLNQSMYIRNGSKMKKYNWELNCRQNQQDYTRCGKMIGKGQDGPHISGMRDQVDGGVIPQIQNVE